MSVPLIPLVQEDERLRPSSQQEILRALQEKWNPIYYPENVTFIHDEDWRQNIVSIQAAADWRGPWQYVAIMFIAGQVAFIANAVMSYWLLFKVLF